MARTPTGGRLLAWSVTNFDAILPVQRLVDSANILAFYHPQPAYPFHILIVPKQPISDLLMLREEHAALLFECYQTVQDLVKRFNLDGHGYRLLVNGGKYQDIPQIHFHLISESSLITDRINDEPSN